MKKIVTYIGSRRGNNSNTYKFAKEILDGAKNKLPDIEYEIITSDQVNINPCEGCHSCFSKAECVLDKSDDMKILRQKLIDADFVIFGSPVYAHNISGDMKIFFDRSSYWMHLMRLHGKGSMVISTTATNGHKTAVDYMSKVMYYYGTKLVAKYNCAMYHPPQFSDYKWMKDTVNILSDEIIKSLMNPIKSNKNLEVVFKDLKTIMTNCINNNINNGELEYWVKSGLIKYDTFEEFLENECNKKVSYS